MIPIDNHKFAIQAFAKLYIMNDYSNPKCIKFYDYFINIDISLIYKEKYILLIHSSFYL